MQPPSWPIEVADRLSLLWLQQHPLRRRRRQRDEGCQEEEDVEVEEREPWENSSRVYYFCWKIEDKSTYIRSIIVVVRLTLRVWLPTYFGLHY